MHACAFVSPLSLGGKQTCDMRVTTMKAKRGRLSTYPANPDAVPQ